MPTPSCQKIFAPQLGPGLIDKSMATIQTKILHSLKSASRFSSRDVKKSWAELKAIDQASTYYSHQLKE
jgi:hypothetical protein